MIDGEMGTENVVIHVCVCSEAGDRTGFRYPGPKPADVEVVAAELC